MARPVIILYTDQAQIMPEVLVAMTEAGYLPVKVADAEAIRVLDIPVANSLGADELDAILAAALTAIKQSGVHRNEYTGAFGLTLATLLLAKSKPDA